MGHARAERAATGGERAAPRRRSVGAGHNIIQSEIALGSGGFWGEGYLRGNQGHLAFLPEKQTDFIFTMIGEEFGFVGGLVVMGLLSLIIMSAMGIALRCRDQFGRLVALGVACNFRCMCCQYCHGHGGDPGVPLPLASHGGSAMLTVMVGFGILMSVHVHRDAGFRGGRDGAGG